MLPNYLSAHGPLPGSPSTALRRVPHWLRRAGLVLLATLATMPAGFSSIPGFPEIAVEQPAGTVLGADAADFTVDTYSMQSSVPAPTITILTQPESSSMCATTP